MNKILRNVCVTALAMIGIIANAQTVVTFVPNETKGESSANDSPDKMTKDGITIESTDAAFNANGNKHYRFYQNSTTTITSTAGNITKIEFTCDIDKKGKYGSNGFDGTEGYTFTEDKKEGTWVGNATSVQFAAKYQVRASKIVITAAEGAKIYYTTDNSVPTTTSNLYSAPFELTATTTVKAIAVKDGKESSVAEKTFTKEELAVANSIAEFKALEKDQYGILKLNAAKVLYTWTSNNGNTSVYVRDHSGAILLYKHSLGLKTNEDLNGEIAGQYKEYNAIPELIEIDGVTNINKLNHVDGTAAEPKVITPATASENLCDLVKLEKVKITTEDSKKYYVVEGENKVQLYNGFHLSDFDNMEKFANSDDYDVVGIVASVYKGTPSINIISIKKNVPDAIENIEVAKNENAPIYNLAGQRVDKNYKGVVIQNGKKFINK